MFENIGGKIKGLAKFICWVGIVICVIAGIIMFIQAGEAYYSADRTVLIITGLAIIIVGSLMSWIGSFLLYGFGELVDNSSKIRQELSELPSIVERSKPSVEVHYQSSDNKKSTSPKQTLADFDV